MIKINVITNNIKWFQYIKKPKKYLESKLNKLNSKDKTFKKNNIFCTLLLSNSKEIKFLNKKFRKKNKPTDVLSFPFQNKHELTNKLKKEKEIYLGDIIINLSIIKYKKSLKNFKYEFDHTDVVRHPLVSKIIRAYQKKSTDDKN